MKNDLLLQVLERYSSCQSYTDEGVQNHSLRQSAKFASYFVRPDRFRFEWRGKAPFRFTLCIVGDEARLSMGDISLDNRLPDDAINRSMGLSMSQVPFIVSLLVPGQFDLTYNLLDYGPFEESESEQGADGNRWFTSLEKVGVPQEKPSFRPVVQVDFEENSKSKIHRA